MNRKMKYISWRLFFCAGLGIVLLFAALGMLWLTWIGSGQGLFPITLLTAAAAAYLCCMYRLVIIPYKETHKIYEQFILGVIR
jgi:two-component system sensor histidine kinase YesM